MNPLIILFILSFIGLVKSDTSSLSIHDSLGSLGDQGLGNNTLNMETINKDKEMELERANKVNRNFERLIQLVNILGQVDTFLSERTKSMMRKLALLAQDDDGYYRRRRS